MAKQAKVARGYTAYFVSGSVFGIPSRGVVRGWNLRRRPRQDFSIRLPRPHAVKTRQLDRDFKTILISHLCGARLPAQLPEIGSRSTFQSPGGKLHHRLIVDSSVHANSYAATNGYDIGFNSTVFIPDESFHLNILIFFKISRVEFSIQLYSG